MFGCALAACGLPAQAADLLVTTTRDEYDGQCNAHCSLRDAIRMARFTDNGRIVLKAGTYTLTRAPGRDEDGDILDEDANANGDLDVRYPARIVGAGPEQTIIDGGGLDRIFEVTSGSRLALERLRLSNGRTSQYGGAVENHGSLSLDQVRVQGNAAASGFAVGSGGGIANFGTLDISRSSFEDNRAGGGEASYGRGGGLYNAGVLFIRDSSVTRNAASDDNDIGLGGGLYNVGNADIARAAFIGNSVSVYGAGAAIDNAGGQLKLTNVTLSGNVVPENDGAALDNGDRFSGNAAAASLTLIHVTVADNRGYGLANRGKVLIRNSIVAGNQDGLSGEARNCFNSGTQAVYKAVGLLLATGPGNCTGSISVDNADTFRHQLFPLAYNSGLTQSHALRGQSLAIDRAMGSCTRQDQRRLDRPRDGDGDGMAVCDLGAFERARP
jgi:CSLREA domain-containing protein